MIRPLLIGVALLAMSRLAAGQSLGASAAISTSAASAEAGQIATPMPGTAAPAAAPAGATPEFEITPRGYVQIDWRGFPDWGIVPGVGRLSRDSFEVRRLRIGVEGRWRWLEYEATIDPQDNDGVFARDVYGQTRLPGGFRLRVGQFKVPGSAEYGEPARTLDLLERSAFAMTIAPGRDIGAMVSGRIGRPLAFDAGVFAGDGNGRDSRSGTTAAARLVWRTARDLDVAASTSVGTTSAADAEPANGLVGRSTVWYRFFDRVYVDGVRTRFGGDVRWSPGGWRVTGEIMRAHDERRGQGQEFDDLPGVVGLGWSAAVRRQLGRRGGAARSRWREMDLTLRLDGLSFDDTGAATGRDSVRLRAADIRARSVTTATAGLSWVPVRWGRILTSVAREHYGDARSAPTPGRADYWSAGVRLQLELP